MKKFIIYVALAIAAVLPGLIVRFAGIEVAPLTGAVIFFAALLGAGFLLSWGVEAAEGHVSQGLAIAVLALITVLPEYAVDIYLSYQAGAQPGTLYAGFAAANMTGANRLLIGFVWSAVVLLFWWRSRKTGVQLKPENSIEIVFLLIPTLYSFVILLKDRIDLFDTAIFAGIFAAYIWRVGKLPKDDDEEDDEEETEVGPAAALEELPKRQQYAVMAVLGTFAAVAIFALAEPFAEALIATGAAHGVNQFLLIQWLAPLAGEAPEIIIAVLFTLALRPTVAMGALVSDKINQWTLLVGMIPLAFSIGAGRVGHLALDARQHEEFFLTAAQSLFAVALIVCLRLSLRSAAVLLGLFLVQLALAFIYQQDEARTITTLTYLAWLYLILAFGVFISNRRCLIECVRMGLLSKNKSEIESKNKNV
jgi:cation:H+ antiporter